MREIDAYDPNMSVFVPFSYLTSFLQFLFLVTKHLFFINDQVFVLMFWLTKRRVLYVCVDGDCQAAERYLRSDHPVLVSGGKTCLLVCLLPRQPLTWAGL